jgi:hypothetical protein
MQTPGPGTAPAVGQQQTDPLAARLAALEKKVDNIGRRVPTPLVVGPPDAPYLAIQPSGWHDADGNDIYTLTIRDDQGNILFSMFPTTTDPSGLGTDWAYAWLDRAGNQIIASDGKTGVGLALPYSHIPMYALFTSTSFTAGPTDYSQILNSTITTEKVIWTGVAQFVVSPAIYINGTWGMAETASLGNYTYHIKINGTIVGTWTVLAGGFDDGNTHVFDISSFVGQLDAAITITVVVAGPTAGTHAAVQCAGVALGQTPEVFG